MNNILVTETVVFNDKLINKNELAHIIIYDDYTADLYLYNGTKSLRSYYHKHDDNNDKETVFWFKDVFFKNDIKICNIFSLTQLFVFNHYNWMYDKKYSLNKIETTLSYCDDDNEIN